MDTYYNIMDAYVHNNGYIQQYIMDTYLQYPHDQTELLNQVVSLLEYF